MAPISGGPEAYAELSFHGDPDISLALDLQALVDKSANKTKGLSPSERRAKAREVAQDLMRFWRFSTGIEDSDLPTDFINDAGDLTVENFQETASAVNNVTLAKRRRELTRHAKAGVVEYRIFGEILSRDASTLDELCIEQASYLQVWKQIGGFFNFSGWADGLEIDGSAQSPEEAEAEMAAQEMLIGWGMPAELLQAPSPEELKRQQDEQLQQEYEMVQNGTTWWKGWWVPGGARAFFGGLYWGFRSFEEGKGEPAAACGPWLSMLAERVKRSGRTEAGAAAFPALLLAVPVARMGDLESVAVYLLATELAGLNAKAISEREGFGSRSGSAGEVADYEAKNTELAISMEVNKIVVPYILLFFTLFVGLPFAVFVTAIWSLVSGVSSGAIDSELAGDPVYSNIHVQSQPPSQSQSRKALNYTSESLA